MSSIILYHGSPHKIAGELKPVLKHSTSDHIHDLPAVFATERIDVASLFMFPVEVIHSIGFEQDIAYICIWGTSEEFLPKDKGGFVYRLPSTSFEKIGKKYEWQSFEEVTPGEVIEFPSVIAGMIESGVQVYFINNEMTFDKIVAEKDNRAPILRELISENQKQNINAKNFTR
ncbi:MAG: hypothetical protein Q7S32_01240 [bacterium]|nr:hypothetical protein [bacterium]